MAWDASHVKIVHGPAGGLPIATAHDRAAPRFTLPFRRRGGCDPCFPIASSARSPECAEGGSHIQNKRDKDILGN